MDTQPLLSHIISDMAQALCQRRDEPQVSQVARAQAAAQSILAFQPGDAIEAMIAGHCVMFHELIVDSARTTLRGELDATRRGIVAMDKAFGANLVRLEKYRARHADSIPADARAETEMADRVHRHQSDPASAAPRTEADQVGLTVIDTGHAAAEAIPRSAPSPRALDIHAAAGAQMPGLNRQARRAIGRQSGKRIDPARLTVSA